jgi:hypothetical protein
MTHPRKGGSYIRQADGTLQQTRFPSSAGSSIDGTPSSVADDLIKAANEAAIATTPANKQPADAKKPARKPRTET